ncbi:MCE family protein [Nemorincola caseinilytica]|uniref:MCE family protein n=1 Tax=Nemorincola caseinilytica TaxID=2054315 RepID=A0ABP8NNQ0_9BACT
MKATTGQKIKIGIFTISGLLILVAGIFLIGSKKNMFNDTFIIYGTFKNVGGLEIGNNIRFAGINVGTVKDIRIVADTQIRVDMLMKEEVRPFLKSDALASIGSDGLMGDKLITIVSGSDNGMKLLSGGSRIRTVDPIDLDRVISQFTHIASNAEIITGELASMAVQIRKGDGTISRLLYSDDLSESMEGTARNAEKITGSLAGIASQLQSGRGSVGQLIYTDSFSNLLTSAGTIANSAMLTIQEGASGFSENMKALQSNFLFRKYFKNKTKQPDNGLLVEDTAAYSEADEDELRTIISEAQKALDAKQKKK